MFVFWFVQKYKVLSVFLRNKPIAVNILGMLAICDLNTKQLGISRIAAGRFGENTIYT